MKPEPTAPPKKPTRKVPPPEAVGLSERDIASLPRESPDEPLAEDPLGNVPLPPEIVASRLEELTTWDEAPEDHGRRVEPIIIDDEAETGQRLVEEGLDEAEEELRALEEQREQEEDKEVELEEQQQEEAAHPAPSRRT